MGDIREDVLGLLARAKPLGGATALAGKWYLLEGDEMIDPAVRDQVVTLQGETISRGGAVVGRYAILDNHAELAFDDQPTIFIWRAASGDLVGAQQYAFEAEDPYRVMLRLEPVPAGERDPAPELSLSAA